MQASSYWWEAAPPARLTQQDVLPACDVAIVGAGYTGLSAAITLARAGRSVQVFDKQRPGELYLERLAGGGLAFARNRAWEADLQIFTYFGASSPNQ